LEKDIEELKELSHRLSNESPAWTKEDYCSLRRRIVDRTVKMTEFLKEWKTRRSGKDHEACGTVSVDVRKTNSQATSSQTRKVEISNTLTERL
jgi:hypothetical protein